MRILRYAALLVVIGLPLFACGKEPAHSSKAAEPPVVRDATVATVTAAELRLTIVTKGSANRVFGTHRLTKAWLEKNVTWAKADSQTWATVGGDFIGTPTGTTETGTTTGLRTWEALFWRATAFSTICWTDSVQKSFTTEASFMDALPWS